MCIFKLFLWLLIWKITQNKFFLVFFPFPQVSPNPCVLVFFRHGECPTPENTETFIRVCEHFSDKNPSELIGTSYIHLMPLLVFILILHSYSYILILYSCLWLQSLILKSLSKGISSVQIYICLCVYKLDCVCYKTNRFFFFLTKSTMFLHLSVC